MPRGPRLDAPGVLQHVMVRGIERRRIFCCDRDRQDLLDRLSRILPESGMACFAWAFMPNHVHLVVQTGLVPLARVMARINTGYARSFNRRHARVGYLFQGRYKSILVDEEAQLLALIRYVHLNPIRAGLVGSLEVLGRHRWTGHATLIGFGEAPFQNTQTVLQRFGGTIGDSRGRLLEWMKAGLDAELEASQASRGPHDPSAALPQPGPTSHSRRVVRSTVVQPQVRLMRLIRRVCTAHRIAVHELRGSVRTRRAARARAEIAYRACFELEISGVDVARALGISKAAVTQARARGCDLVVPGPRGPGRKLNF